MLFTEHLRFFSELNELWEHVLNCIDAQVIEITSCPFLSPQKGRFCDFQYGHSGPSIMSWLSIDLLLGVQAGMNEKII